MAKNKGLSFSDYLKLIYESASKNSTVDIRGVKLKRFVGSILSIYASEKSNQKIILLPNVNQFGTEHVDSTCIFNGRKYAKIPNISDLIETYVNKISFDQNNYVESIIDLCEKVFLELSRQLRI
jgi:hypothetical protein